MIALASVLTLALVAADPEPDPISGPPPEATEPKLVPPYVPRSISFGLLFNAPMVTPNVRIDWNVDLFASSQHTFYILGEVGSGFGVSRPPGMTSFFQHMLAVGFGYRNTARIIHWGFQFGIGPLWYRNFYTPILPYAAEDRVLGYAEGRLQAGVQVAPHLLVGIYFGFASPWTIDSSGRYPGNLYLGGFMPGLYLDWN